MAMNIARLQAQLQHIPDQVLVGYVQNPTGQVPSYLALTELTRRKEIRNSGTQQPAQDKPSVADQLIQEAQPVESTEGLAALPVPEDMYSEQSMAAGGIISFARGDIVPEFRVPSLYQPTKQFLRNAGESVSQYLSRITRESGIPISELSSNPAVAKEIGGEAPNYGERENLMVPDGSFDFSAANIPAPKPVAPVSIGGAGGAGVPSGGGIGALKFKPLEGNSARYDDFQRPELSATEKMSEFQNLIGQDTGAVERAERLARMQEATAKEKETAPWMALAEAGLSMAAGSSPYALQNIAAGGAKGLESLAKAKEKISAAEERQFDLADRMAQAKRSEDIAAAKYGIESSEAIKARNEQNKLAKLGYENQVKLANYNREFETDKVNTDIGFKKAELAQNATKIAQDAAQHKASIDMFNKKLAASSGATQARLVETKRKAYLDAQTVLAPDFAALMKKYGGDTSSPDFQREKQLMVNQYVANALSLSMDDMDARDSDSL